MNTAAEILKLIEAVEPSDCKMMDEIDALTWVNFTDHGWSMEDLKPNYREMGFGWFCRKASGFIVEVPKYTRSRDALKAIRPQQGCSVFRLFNEDSWDAWKCQISWWPNSVASKWILSASLPTEELAELHAIIQAIECERQQVVS